MAEVFGAVASGVSIAEVASRVRALFRLIDSYKRRDRIINGLLAELRAVVKLLDQIDTVMVSPADHEDLDLPLRQCGNLCKDFEELVLKCTRHSDDKGKSKRDWTRVTIEEDEIRCVRGLIDSYKSTINVVIGTMNLRTNRMNARDLRHWCETISSTSCRLEKQMVFIDQQIQKFSGRATTMSAADTLQQQWLQVERKKIDQCLAICARGVDETQQLIEELPKDTQPVEGTIKAKITAKDLSEVFHSNNERLGDIRNKYSKRLQDIEDELHAIRLANYGSLRQTGEEHRHKVFEKASKEATKRYEEVRAAEGACQIISSPPGDDLYARQITAGPRSEQYLGVSEAVLLARFQNSRPQTCSLARDDEPESSERVARGSRARFGILRRLLL